MTPKEIKQKKAEHARVLAARLEQEIRIDDLMEQVTRLQESIALSEKREADILAELKGE